MITLMSHGFKYGSPKANFVFDVSYLKNPWRYPDRDPQKFMEEQPEFRDIVKVITQVIKVNYVFYGTENLVFAVCCSAGEYRSVIVAQAISKELKLLNIPHDTRRS